jgi:two-component system, LytTR family, response regulator
MRNYTCIIIDDEARATSLLIDTISELYENIQVQGIYTHWKDAVKAMAKNDYDILFLDISMPEKSGFDLLSFVPNINGQIIFVTAHPQYAIEAFNYPTAGYVLKPVEDTALNKALNNAIERIDKRSEYQYVAQHKIAIPNQKGLSFVDQNDIVYLEAVAKNTKVKQKAKELISTQSFGMFKSMLGNYPFYQVHRSFIVNLNCIVRYEGIGLLIMNEGSTIPVAKNLREDFLQRYGKQI